MGCTQSRSLASDSRAETRAYEARRTLQGKTEQDIRRCLKRTLAKHLYRVMEAVAASGSMPSDG